MQHDNRSGVAFLNFLGDLRGDNIIALFQLGDGEQAFGRWLCCCLVPWIFLILLLAEN